MNLRKSTRLMSAPFPSHQLGVPSTPLPPFTLCNRQSKTPPPLATFSPPDRPPLRPYKRAQHLSHITRNILPHLAPPPRAPNRSTPSSTTSACTSSPPPSPRHQASHQSPWREQPPPTLQFFVVMASFGLLHRQWAQSPTSSLATAVHSPPWTAGHRSTGFIHTVHRFFLWRITQFPVKF
jgi:hypothetical protein